MVNMYEGEISKRSSTRFCRNVV